MTRKWLLPLLAVAGLAIALLMVRHDREPPQTAASAIRTAQSPFVHYIFGAGLIEASTGNIAIGTPVAGIVAELYVKWGDPVKAGDPLFKIDDRDLRVELPTAAARVQEAEVTLAEARYLLQKAAQMHDEKLLSDEEFSKRRFHADGAAAAFALSRAEAERISREIARRVVRSPSAGRVLQINIRPGESTQSGVAGKALMVIGDDKRLFVRIDVDESDIWRFHPDAAARAFVRGNAELSVPLQFERVEPLVVPKKSLTGGGAERTDTRVLQVIYGFARENRPVQIGQQMDVFIEVPAVERTKGEQPAALPQSAPQAVPRKAP